MFYLKRINCDRLLTFGQSVLKIFNCYEDIALVIIRWKNQKFLVAALIERQQENNSFLHFKNKYINVAAITKYERWWATGIF